MATASGEIGANPSIGHGACLRRELSGEPDVGNLHLRFDEGRGGRAIRVALSPTLPCRSHTVADWNATGAHVARQPRKTQTPADVAAQINNQTVTSTLFEI